MFTPAATSSPLHTAWTSPPAFEDGWSGKTWLCTVHVNVSTLLPIRATPAPLNPLNSNPISTAPTPVVSMCELLTAAGREVVADNELCDGPQTDTRGSDFVAATVKWAEWGKTEMSRNMRRLRSIYLNDITPKLINSTCKLEKLWDKLNYILCVTRLAI